MKGVSLVLVIISIILLVVAIISRLLLTPLPIAGIESQAIGQLVTILLLFAIAINTSK